VKSPTVRRWLCSIPAITLITLPVWAQVRVELSKTTQKIPKDCKLVVPAVYQEMMRLKEGAWLPRVNTVNAGRYPALSDKVNWDWSSTFSNYVRFVTEIKGVRINP